MNSKLNEHKLNYLKKFHQFFLFDTNGVILDSCHSIFDFSKEIEHSTVFDIFPYTLSFQNDIETLKKDTSILHECVGMTLKGVQGTYDISITRHSENEFSLVLENRTEKNLPLQSIQQERNESIIQKEIIERQSKIIAYKNKALETKNKALDSFAHTISHDLKEPSNLIVGLLDLFFDMHDKELNKDAKETLSFVKQASKRMSELVSSVLDYTKNTNKKTEAIKFSFQKLLDEVLESVNISEGFKVEFLSSDFKLKTNKTQLYQVLSNLISNAIKYNDKENGKAIISCISDSDSLEISIKDNGPGIHEMYHSLIFEMFGTAIEDNEGHANSTGIGLATVKNLVEQNGGEISLDSKEGEGSTFTFTWKSIFDLEE